MSRTRLAVWGAGAALLAAWLSSAAGTMPGRAPARLPAAAPVSPPPAPVAEAAEPEPEAARPAARRDQAPRPRPVVRNPFTFAPSGPAAAAPELEPVVPVGWAPNPAAAAAQDRPLQVSLAGIAADETPDGLRRTAILSVEGRVVLAQVGDEIPGSYRVERIDADAVELFAPGRGTSHRLRLP